MQNRFRILTVLIVIMGVATYFALKSKNQHSDLSTESPLKVAEFPGTISAAIELTKQRGYFADEGVNVQITPTDSKFLIEQMDKGEFDIGYNGLSADLMNANIRGIKIKVIADLSQGGSALLVRKDLWDSGKIRSIKDLRGRTVRAAREGSGSYYSLAYELQQAGLDINKDINLKTTSQADVLPAFESKTIDAADLGAEPFITYAVERGLAVALPLPPMRYQLPVLIATDKVLAERPEKVRAFLRAYLKGIQVYLKAYEGKEPERQETVKIISELSGVPPETVNKMTWHYVSPDGVPNLEQIQKMIDFFHSNGNISKKINVAEIADLSFLPQE